MPLDFTELRKANVERCETAYHPVAEWSPTDWACAMAGEAGEACNSVKKLRRLGFTPETIPDADTASGRYAIDALKKDIAKELADVVIYADLLAARLDIDLGDAVRAKFNEVSERVRSYVKL